MEVHRILNERQVLTGVNYEIYGNINWEINWTNHVIKEKGTRIGYKGN